ncbi:MAG: hypothetical protein KDB18_11630, partial [Salinibacterium sp.]|nr:hypothetical protein [Salinibacterium sp.]
DLQRQLESKDKTARKKGLRHYSPPESTRSYIESNYWRRTRSDAGGDLIRVNEFWLDFARCPEGQPFVSRHFILATGNLSEMLLALADLDLPFKAAEHAVKVSGKRLDLTAGSPLLLMREELSEAGTSTDTDPLLISQRFYRLDDPYVYNGNERRDKYVTGEFLVGTGYGSRIVLTNPTSATRKLEVLYQIPRGALPIRKGAWTRSINIELDGYGTMTAEFFFYFPAEGQFEYYPARANHDGGVVARAEGASMTVVRKLSTVDETSWNYVSQNADGPTTLKHLDTHNIRRLDLTRIAWRMRDRSFFDQTLKLLRERHAYDEKLWSYAFLHHDADGARQYLENQDGFLASCGAYLDSPLVAIDPVERLSYQHVDYAPLFNPRAHPFGRRREILNDDFKQQFARLVSILAHRPALSDSDRMSLTCYYLLQDRIEEALGSFARIDPEKLETRIQYDYLRAYLDFFSTDHALARGIA